MRNRETEGLRITAQIQNRIQRTDMKREKIKEDINIDIVSYTKQLLETIQKDTERDNYMTAQQAKEYGLIDEIMESISNIKENK